MSRWKWILLIFEMALFLVILFLPQVDLPDFTFQGGTAPVVAKARVSGPPAHPLTVAVVKRTVFPEVRETILARIILPPSSHAGQPFLLSCALLC